MTWSVKPIIPSSAKTIVRLWNEVYTLKNIDHTFVDMTSPKEYDKYYAGIRHGEVLVIVGCKKKKSVYYIHKVANSLECYDGLPSVIKILKEQNITSGYTSEFEKSQPNIFLEILYLKEKI